MFVASIMASHPGHQSPPLKSQPLASAGSCRYAQPMSVQFFALLEKQRNQYWRNPQYNASRYTFCVVSHTTGAGKLLLLVVPRPLLFLACVAAAYPCSVSPYV